MVTRFTSRRYLDRSSAPPLVTLGARTIDPFERVTVDAARQMRRSPHDLRFGRIEQMITHNRLVERRVKCEFVGMSPHACISRVARRGEGPSLRGRAGRLRARRMSGREPRLGAPSTTGGRKSEGRRDEPSLIAPAFADRRYDQTASRSRSMAASSSAVPWTFGPLNHLRAETTYQMEVLPMTTARAIGV